MNRELRAFAAAQGFPRLFVCHLPDYSRWRARVDAVPARPYAHLTDDVAALFPGECRAIVLVRPYTPYDFPPGCATVSAYYPASNAAHQAARDVARWIEVRGHRALAGPPIPYKPIIAQSGHAAYGRNGVTGMESLGSRYVLQVVLTNAPLPFDLPGPEQGEWSAMCARCHRCVDACPTGALDGTGRVDVHKCLRARSDEFPMAEVFRKHIGRSLLGCDVCQDVCPRNARVESRPAPAELAEALRLESLLAGDVGELAKFIGSNMARKARTRAKACVIAANAGRTDLIPLVEKCAADSVDFVRDHAQWALERLERSAGGDERKPG